MCGFIYRSVVLHFLKIVIEEIIGLSLEVGPSLKDVSWYCSKFYKIVHRPRCLKDKTTQFYTVRLLLARWIIGLEIHPFIV